MTSLDRRQVLALTMAAASAGVAGPAFAQTQDMRLMPMVLGKADAPIEVVEYASFTCPHCANFHTKVFPTLKLEYIDTGKMRMEMREVYFDRYGLWAAMVARCGGGLRYFGIVDEIYRTQGTWSKAATDAEIVTNLSQIGRLAGLTDEQLEACLGDQEFASALVKNYQENATRDEVQATPSFLINGEKYSNMSLAEFKETLDGMLS